MKTVTPWNTEAEKIFADWIEARQQRWLSEGADPVEVAADLRAHLEERFAESNTNVTAEQIRTELQSMGIHPLVPESQAKTLEVKPTKKKGIIASFFAYMTDSVVGVCVIPLVVIFFELFSKTSANMFFDPFGRWPQLVAVIAGALLAGYCTIKRKSAADHPTTNAPTWHAILRGAGLAVCSYWTLAFTIILFYGSALYLIGVCATIGLGIIAFPIYFLCAIAAGAPLLVWLGMYRKGKLIFGSSATWTGLGIGILLLILIEAPSYTARLSVNSGKLIGPRSMISESTLLKICYEGNRGFTMRRNNTDIAGAACNILLPTKRAIDASSTARILFFELTGKPFNSVTPPFGILGASRGSSQFNIDTDLGGDAVAAKVPNLDLTTSRIDGHIDSASQLAYWEWTMEFSNTSSSASEARMQLLLPSGAVVSRLTLWVNDEPREAAFSSTAKVTAAYKSVAVVQRRDPVLVRWMAPDRVLVQCFPVPANGKMKIRVGITAPVQDSKIAFPRIIERNYGFPQEFATSCWIQGDCGLSADGLGTSATTEKHQEIHGELPIKNMVTQSSHVEITPQTTPAIIWTKDPFSPPSTQILVRRIAEGTSNQIQTQRYIAVVDTSAGLDDYQNKIADGLKSLSSKSTLTAIYASTDDGYKTLKADDISSLRFIGGKDIRPALHAAIDEAIKQPDTTILWFAGPQPESFKSIESIVQLLERAFHTPTIALFDCKAGNSRVLENLSQIIRVIPGGTIDRPDEIPSAIERFTAPSQKISYEWTRQSEPPTDGQAVKVWDQIARWHAWEDFADPSKKQNRDTAAIAAAKYQLVTPFSGAVVLETAQQYKDHGLTPVDPNSTPNVPTIPEPSSVLLALIGGVLALMRRSRAA